MATLPCVQQTTQPSHVVQNEGIEEGHGDQRGAHGIKEGFEGVPIGYTQEPESSVT